MRSRNTSLQSCCFLMFINTTCVYYLSITYRCFLGSEAYPGENEVRRNRESVCSKVINRSSCFYITLLLWTKYFFAIATLPSFVLTIHLRQSLHALHNLILYKSSKSTFLLMEVDQMHPHPCPKQFTNLIFWPITQKRRLTYFQTSSYHHCLQSVGRHVN